MTGRYQEGYVQGARKARAEAEIEISHLQQEIIRLTRKLNDLCPVSGSEGITLGCRCGWVGKQYALLQSWNGSVHCPKCGSDFAAWQSDENLDKSRKSADPVQHPWGGAF